MSNVTEYSSKATALRGIARLGMTDKARAEGFILPVIGTTKFSVDADQVNAALGLSEAQNEEDEALILFCGHSHCPSCNVHLSNGISDFDGMSERHGGDKAAFKHQQFEHACMGCWHQWGAPIVVKGSKARGEPTRHYVNKSTVDGAVSLSHSIFDANPDARRKDAIQLAVDAGIAFYTARTQYQKWFKGRKASKAK